MKSSVKQESQRRLRSASWPVRSVTSSTVVQKHVGHTEVQFPQVRQRSATSSQRGCSRFAWSSSRRSPASISRPICPAARSAAASGAPVSASVASRLGSSARTSAPSSLPTSTVKRCPSPSSTSVSARSKPWVHRGPVPIDTQKQVPPAWPQLTATTNAPRRRAA